NAKLSVEDLAARFRGELIPITSRFSYFSALPIPEEDLKQYLHDPIAAVSPAICQIIPLVGFVLVPYLERANGKHGEMVNFERPAEARSLAAARASGENPALVLLAIKDTDIADYHYTFYNVLA